MDSVDKKIMMEFDKNCRISYEAIARDLGISSNAVKKRVSKLIDSGRVDKFLVALSLDMMNADLVMALVHTDGSEYQEELVKQIGDIPEVIQVSNIACGIGSLYSVFAQITGSQGLLAYGSTLRSLNSVIDVELHVLTYPRGKKVEIKNIELRVLKHLLEDPRMTISELASRSGLTARRVRRILDTLLEGRGFDFAVMWNLGIGGLTEVLIRINWNVKETSIEEVIDWLNSNFDEFWSAFISANHPVAFARFLVSELEIAESAARRIRKAKFVDSVSILVLYSNNIFSWPGVDKLRELIAKRLGDD